MKTLYLLAPRSRNNPRSHHKDFYTIMASGVGPDYGISKNQMSQIHIGMSVVLFDRDRPIQASGTVGGWSATTKAGNGVQRYNIALQGLVPEGYSNPPNVNRFGVAIY
jgi:hypothetical protein